MLTFSAAHVPVIIFIFFHLKSKMIVLFLEKSNKFIEVSTFYLKQENKISNEARKIAII